MCFYRLISLQSIATLGIGNQQDSQLHWAMLNSNISTLCTPSSLLRLLKQINDADAPNAVGR